MALSDRQIQMHYYRWLARPEWSRRRPVASWRACATGLLDSRTGALAGA